MKYALSRRAVLRGAGVSLALPFLELMSPRSLLGSTSVPAGPVRIAYFYVPNGVNMEHWRPAAEGVLTELPKILQPLEPIKNHVTVLSNLAADHCNGKSAAHEPAGGGFLVGQRCKHSEEPEVGNASVDQVVASHIGQETPLDSLTLGIDPGHRGDHGYSGTYMSNISWRNKTTPAAMDLNPKQLYERLFRNNQVRQSNAPVPSEAAAESLEANVLDLVREEAKSLQRRLGYSDRLKMEQYLEGIRSIERRVSSADRNSHSHHQDGFANAPLVDEHEGIVSKLIIPDGKGIPSLYADHVNLMLDILTVAFQTDMTRVASFMFSYEKSGRSYPQIEAPGSHHSTSHHQKKTENLDQLTRINTHHMELFSRMLQRMSQIDEGGKSLLDNVMICYGSGISDGNKHNHDDLPILVAGKAGGALDSGRHVLFDKKTPICNLYLDMMHRMQVTRESFGDSTGRLTGLERA
jgi:hypothetical protein